MIARGHFRSGRNAVQLGIGTRRGFRLAAGHARDTVMGASARHPVSRPCDSLAVERAGSGVKCPEATLKEAQVVSTVMIKVMVATQASMIGTSIASTISIKVMGILVSGIITKMMGATRHEAMWTWRSALRPARER